MTTVAEDLERKAVRLNVLEPIGGGFARSRLRDACPVQIEHRDGRWMLQVVEGGALRWVPMTTILRWEEPAHPEAE